MRFIDPQVDFCEYLKYQKRADYVAGYNEYERVIAYKFKASDSSLYFFGDRFDAGACVVVPWLREEEE